MSAFNYIKAHRKRWSLTQEELGFILGYGGNTQISNIERGIDDPNTREMIAFEVLFEKSNSRLFPDLYTSVSEKLLRRLAMFEDHLCEEPVTRVTVDKLNAVRKIRRSLEASNNERV